MPFWNKGIPYNPVCNFGACACSHIVALYTSNKRVQIRGYCRTDRVTIWLPFMPARLSTAAAARSGWLLGSLVTPHHHRVDRYEHIGQCTLYTQVRIPTQCIFASRLDDTQQPRLDDDDVGDNKNTRHCTASTDKRGSPRQSALRCSLSVWNIFTRQWHWWWVQCFNDD